MAREGTGGAIMTRAQRRRHAWLWIALGPALLLALAAALSGRPPVPVTINLPIVAMDPAEMGDAATSAEGAP